MPKKSISTPAGLARQMIIDSLPVLDDLLEDGSSWDDLVKAVQRNRCTALMFEGTRGDIQTAFENSLSDVQKKQYVELEGDDVARHDCELEAAFELGRQMEQASSGGAR